MCRPACARFFLDLESQEPPFYSCFAIPKKLTAKIRKTDEIALIFLWFILKSDISYNLCSFLFLYTFRDLYNFAAIIKDSFIYEKELCYHLPVNGAVITEQLLRQQAKNERNGRCICQALHGQELMRHISPEISRTGESRRRSKYGFQG